MAESTIRKNCNNFFITVMQTIGIIVAAPKQPLPEHTRQRNQLKTLDDNQKQDITDICKNRDENEDSQINHKLATFVNEEDLGTQSIRNHCKLKDSQRLNILNLHFMKNLNRTRISDKLKIPDSAVSRIIRSFNTIPGSTKAWFERRDIKVSESPKIDQVIKDYVKSLKTTFNSSSIAKFIKQEFNMSVWKQSIAKFLKRELRMSYRKASSRSTKANSMTNQMLKNIFWIEFFNLADNSNVYVNIDLVLFSNSIKINYTWCERGSHNIAYNSSFTNSMALISYYILWRLVLLQPQNSK